MNKLFLDLETCNATSDIAKELIAENIKPPGAIKKPESLLKWHDEKKPQAILDAIGKTGLNGLYGEIVCIGYAVDDNPVETISRDVGGSEKELLTSFFDALVVNNGVNFNPQWVGHNIAGFDLPFLFKRLLINNVKPSIYVPKNPTAWSKDVFDTLYEVTGKNMAGGTLDAISRLLGLGHKTDGMSGSDVNQYWLDGRINEISEYCANDVNLCREIYKRINFIG